MSVSGGCCVVVGGGGGGRGAKPRVGGCGGLRPVLELSWVGLGSVVVGLGSFVWWASVSVSGGWWWWWSGGEAKGGWVCVGCWEVCVSRLLPRFYKDGTFPAI